MSGKHPIYRRLLRLYPRAFRGRYGDELVQCFDDLVTDRGLLVASYRTAGDIARTVLRYRLDASMGGRRNSVGGGVALIVVLPLALAVISVSFLAGIAATAGWQRLTSARGRGKRPSPTLDPEFCWLGIGLSLVAQFLLRFYGVGVWLVGGFVAGVVASRLWLTLRHQRAPIHRPLPMRRGPLYWAGTSLMAGGFALFAIMVMPYWFVGRSLAGEIGAPPGYSRTDIDIRNPVSLAFEYERFLASTDYVRNQPATEAQIRQEITVWLADRGFDVPGTLGERQVLGRPRSDECDADLASFSVFRAGHGAWSKNPLTAEEQTYDRIFVSLDVADQDGLGFGGPIFGMLLTGSVLTLASFIQKDRSVTPIPPPPTGIMTT